MRIFIYANLFFIFSPLTTLCFSQSFSFTNLVKREDDLPVISFNSSSKNFVNVDRDKETETRMMKFGYETFMFHDSSSLHASIEYLGHHCGYIPIKDTQDARMFYFFFKSRGSKNDPVVLWLTGGPGCSSEIALFYENGPFHINEDLSLKWNDFGWDKISNLLYVDQPIGTGFSFSSDDRDIRHNTNEISNDLNYFLQAFFRANPEYVKNDLYIVGESYAGHYIPVLATQLHNRNKAKKDIHINLKGFAIGNGFTNPIYKYSSIPDFALAKKLISKSDYRQIKKAMPKCVKSIQQCRCDVLPVLCIMAEIDNNACQDAYATCSKLIFGQIKIGDINAYDIRKQRKGLLGYDYSKLEKFFALNSVKMALGVGHIKYELYSTKVYQATIDDKMKNYDVFIPPLLEDGIKSLIYAGEYDLQCNWLGNFQWANNIKWSGQNQFRNTRLTSYKVDGKKVGMVKSIGPLTFIKVHDAGHLVPKDQPNISLQMLKNWMNS